MQNRYTGDVGDFGKLGLLRQIAQSNLRIGVNWYLRPDESHNDNGQHIGYLQESKDGEYKGIDDELRNNLRNVVNNNLRSVASYEILNLISNATYYSKVLESPSQIFSRLHWHKAALQKLSNADIVFLDPDNGLLVKSVPEGSQKSNKYVFPREITDYYSAGQSIIFYNHRSRENEQKYLRRFDWFYEDAILKTAKFTAMKFVRGTIRDYFFVLQPEHSMIIGDCLDAMLNSPWNNHFSRLEISEGRNL
jgi:hypothetical protein